MSYLAESTHGPLVVGALFDIVMLWLVIWLVTPRPINEALRTYGHSLRHRGLFGTTVLLMVVLWIVYG